ncbi:MAG: glycosyltransferase [Bacteroidaceae bacterium]|nr:glycosyltransferase [Bacteroidaceae bacterium]
MKISYIIPVYNVPQAMFRECLLSIQACAAAAPSGVECEVVVVDDGSDSPIVIPTSVSGTLDVMLVRQDNQGLSAARNTGISRATGDYIQFVDADDALIPSCYARCLTLLAAEHPDLLSFRFTTKNGQSVSPSPDWHIQTTTGADFLRHSNLRVAAWGYVFAKQLLGGLQFERNLKNEDERFTPQLFLRAEKLIATRIPAYYYRQREGSLQHTYTEAFLRKRFSDCLSTIDYLQSLGEPALDRRINQMKMDFVYNVILYKDRLSDSSALLRKVFPLPIRRYTLKYCLFSILCGSRAGRWLLYRLCRLLPKEA